MTAWVSRATPRLARYTDATPFRDAGSVITRYISPSIYLGGARGVQGFGFGSAAHAVAVFIDPFSGALHFVTIAGGDQGALASSVSRVVK